MAGLLQLPYEGINYVQIPTTLLPQVDSSVDGRGCKSSIKKHHRQLLPTQICHVNIDTLKSLPDRQFSTGMAELIKYGFIWDSEF